MNTPPTYRMVSREEVEDWWKENMAPIPHDKNSLWPFFERVLAERDAFREVAIGQLGDVHLMRDCREACGTAQLSEEVDGLAIKLLSRKVQNVR